MQTSTLPRIASCKLVVEPPIIIGDADLHDSLEFPVIPDSIIPTRLHAIVGEENTTALLAAVAGGVLQGKYEDPDLPKTTFWEAEAGNRQGIPNVVALSFSPFRAMKDLYRSRVGSGNPGFEFICLPGGSDPVREMSRNFCDSLALCQSDPDKQNLWLEIIGCIAAADPTVTHNEISQMIDSDMSAWDTSRPKTTSHFETLTPAHQIMLLAVTRLVELVENNTMVIWDMPEIHLHPRQQQGMIAALLKLLETRNAFAITATHSAIVLQEIPSDCIYYLHTVGSSARAYRPEIHTFAAAVNEIYGDLLHTSVLTSHYHTILETIAANPKYRDYDDIPAELAEQMGMSGLVVLNSILHHKEPKA